MKSFLVFGLGVFGSSVAKTLYEQGHDVLAIDKDKEIVQEISPHVTHAVVVDVIDEETLGQLGVTNFDVAIVAIGSDIHSSIMATLVLKDLGVEHVVAKASNELQGKLLLKIGADRIIYPEREMGERLAKSLSSESILDYIDISPEYSIMEIKAPKELVNKNLIETNLRSKYGITVMAIKKDNGRDVRLFPKAEYTIHEGDSLVLISSDKNLKKFKDKILD